MRQRAVRVCFAFAVASPKAITRARCPRSPCQFGGKCSTPTPPHAAYQVVNHHYRQMLKAARGNEIIVEAERELYVARLERLLRKAFARADDANLSPMIQYLNLQLAGTLAEKIAAANGVATRPKIEADLNVQEKFDPAEEHARAVVERQQLRAAGKMIDVTTKKIEAPRPKERE